MATLDLKEMRKFLWEDKENEGEREGLRGKNNKISCSCRDSNTRPPGYQREALDHYTIGTLLWQWRINRRVMFFLSIQLTKSFIMAKKIGDT